MASSSSNAGNATGPSRTTGLNVSNALHARYSSDPTNDNMPGSTRGQYHPRHGLHGATGVPDHYRSISVPSSNDPPQADHFWAPNEDVDAIHAYPDGQLHTTVTPASNTTVNNNWNPAAVPFVTATPHTYPYVNNTDWAQQTIEEFKLYFGNDANDLSAWQRICRHCSVSEGQIPHTVSGCREALRNVFVNIFDLVFAARNGGLAPIWPDAGALAQYTRHEGKAFPIKVAERAPVMIRFLLRRW